MPLVEVRQRRQTYSIDRRSGKNTIASQCFLHGFGSFPPRVIFVHVDASPELMALQKSVRRHCRTHLGLLHSDYQDLPFHPHITVGFRDLKRRSS